MTFIEVIYPSTILTVKMNIPEIKEFNRGPYLLWITLVSTMQNIVLRFNELLLNVTSKKEKIYALMTFN